MRRCMMRRIPISWIDVDVKLKMFFLWDCCQRPCHMHKSETSKKEMFLKEGGHLDPSLYRNLVNWTIFLVFQLEASKSYRALKIWFSWSPGGQISKFTPGKLKIWFNLLDFGESLDLSGHLLLFVKISQFLKAWNQVLLQDIEISSQYVHLGIKIY